MVEPEKYINKVEKFERKLTRKYNQELYEIYIALPNWYRNGIPNSLKTSATLTHKLGIII